MVAQRDFSCLWSVGHTVSRKSHSKRRCLLKRDKIEMQFLYNVAALMMTNLELQGEQIIVPNPRNNENCQATSTRWPNPQPGI